MKKTLTNAEIEKYIDIISAQNSFRNNTELKLPGNLDWSLRVNIKALNDIYSLYRDARGDLGQKYISAGKVENDRIKPQYIVEYNKELVELMNQTNELDFRVLKVNDFITLPLSMPEKDILFSMCDEEEINKYFDESSTDSNKTQD